jgi:hypothetical protein
MTEDPRPEDYEDDDVLEATDYTGEIPDDAPARQTPAQIEQEKLAAADLPDN